jgi:hypothetical protein
MVRIVWGASSVATFDVALVLEVPEPIRLVLLGELAIELPRPEPAIELHMSLLGVLDFGRKELALDAALHDSRLTRFPLQGAMALRYNWAGHKTLFVAIGGWHPRFQPPPGVPALDRLSISMPSGVISKLTLSGYLAFTFTTLQIGATVDLFVGVEGFGISGTLNFDTLIQRHPFHFDGDISGKVAVSFHGHELLGVHFDGMLVGPRPWRASGHVHVRILLLSATKSFAKTFGDPATDEPVEQVDVGQPLRKALADPRNFSPAILDEAGALVTVHPITVDPIAAATTLQAHPAAAVSIHEDVVPLDLTITRFGTAAPVGDARFTIKAVTVDGAAVRSEPILAEFAPALFLSLSDDEELVSPSFERFPAGVQIAGEKPQFGPDAPPALPIAYDTFFIDAPGAAPRRDPTVDPSGHPTHWRFSVDGLLKVVDAGAISRALLYRTGRQQYAAPAHPVLPSEITYIVATTDQLASAHISPADGHTYSQARAALLAELGAHPERQGDLQVVPLHEAA